MSRHVVSKVGTTIGPAVVVVVAVCGALLTIRPAVVVVVAVCGAVRSGLGHSTPTSGHLFQVWPHQPASYPPFHHPFQEAVALHQPGAGGRSRLTFLIYLNGDFEGGEA